MRLEIAILAVAAALSTGCSDRQQAETQRDVKDATRKAERQMDNAGTTTAVKTKLAADVRLSTLTSIRVESTGSTVSLSGHVPFAADKVKAEAVAKSVDGVTRVINHIEVQP